MVTNRKSDDIRFDRNRDARITHESARGHVFRNFGNVTRGVQLTRLDYALVWQGIKIPLYAALISSSLLLIGLLWWRLAEHEVQLIEMRLFSALWGWVDFDPMHRINLTLPTGRVIKIPMGAVPYNPYVALACAKGWRCCMAAMLGALFITIPGSIWFFGMARGRGEGAMQERHERGAMLVEKDVLVDAILAYNHAKLADAVGKLHPDLDPEKVAAAGMERQLSLGLHVPYTIGSVPYPYDLERTHAFLVGTTGTGKTTVLLDLIAQARSRGHRCVIFDLTGVFIQHFYDPATDHILNPLDTRCPPWTIFSDCETHVEFSAAAAALIPSDGANAEPFWVLAARTLFVEMCVKLREAGEMSNAAIAERLMYASLKDIHAQLRHTVADPLTSEQASRMAESIRAVFNTNAQVLRYLPDATPEDPACFSIRAWIKQEAAPGGILFVSSTHAHLHTTRALITLWMDLAVNAQLETRRNVGLKTWFLFDEVHSLHRLPALEHGLQTARAYGGAFVLGIHSFKALCATYGEEGATNLAALTRTKLLLAAGDSTTAQFCSAIVGNREVREVDEAYSIGASMTRDAATITPRTEVKPLIIPDDFIGFPSLHGVIKFPEGFPAAHIDLQWRAYAEVAEPFCEKRDVIMPRRPDEGGDGGDDGGGAGGRESVPLAATGAAGEAGEIARAEDREEADSSAVPNPQGVLFIDPREITAAERESGTKAGDESGQREGDGGAAKGGADPAFIQQSHKLGGGTVEDKPRDEKANLTGLPDGQSGTARPAQREQQALIDQRTGIGVDDDKPNPHHHAHHHRHDGPEGPSPDDGAEIGL